MGKYLDILRPQQPGAETAPKGRCWCCGAEPEPPPLDRQISILRDLHEARPEIFHWRPDEFLKLRELLREGDVLAVVTSVIPQIFSPMYGSVAIFRDGKLIEIDRRELQDA